MRRIAAFAVLMVGLLLSSLAFAGVAERLGFKLKGVVQGDAKPTLIFTPTEDVKKVTVTLWRSDGAQSTHRVAAIKAGATKRVEIQQPKGKFGYKAKFDVVWAGGDKDTLRIKFDLARAAGLTMHIDPREVDLDGRTLKFTLTTDAKRAELRVFDQHHKPIALVKKDYGGAAAGKKLDIAWKPSKSDLAYLKLRAWNAKGFWTETTLTPVSLRIPHEDVEFDSGRSAIRKNQEPKLRDTLDKLKKAVEMHGQTIAVRLYIAGYCDTVGSAASNRTLSAQRARSIGQWFRRNGLTIPIHYQGFGEDVLAVDTPDETPEQANRRALYLLSTHTPAKSSDVPKQNWKSL